MITFDHGEQRFNYRAAAVIVRSGHLLIHRAETDPCWVLPGGRVEMGETTDRTLDRELREEMAIDHAAPIAVGRLLWIVESFLTWNDTRYHEVGLYRQVELPADDPRFQPPCPPFMGEEAFYLDRPIWLEFRWQPVDRLHEVDVRPAFLAEALKAGLPPHPVHVVRHEGSFTFSPGDDLPRAGGETTDG